MREYSPGDGFVDVTECMADLIKNVANEPSTGLFYIQQHVQKAVPNIVKLRGRISEKSRDTMIYAEDSEDSIMMMRSMKECGVPIADGMIRDITNTLAVIPSKQEKRGLLSRPSWSLPSPSEPVQLTQFKRKGVLPDSSFSAVSRPDMEGEEMPLASPLQSADLPPDELPVNRSVSHQEQHSLSEDFEDFRADREAKLKKWLGGSDKEDISGARIQK